MIDIAPSVNVPGFMQENELEWLARMSEGKKFIAEVGCWMGRSTKVFATHCSGNVLAVDTWEGSEELKFLLEGLPENALFNNWVYYTHEHPNVIFCRMPSLEAADRLVKYGIEINGKLVRMPAFDLVFIDGLHDYENVKADILAWLPCVVDGGILCGHDFHHSPVRKAVTELFGPEHGQKHPDTRMWDVVVHWKQVA